MVELPLQFLGPMDAYLAVPLIAALLFVVMHLAYNLLKLVAAVLSSGRDAGTLAAILRESMQAERNSWRYVAISLALFVMGLVIFAYVEGPSPKFSDLIGGGATLLELVTAKGFSMAFFLSSFIMFYLGFKDVVKLVLYSGDYSQSDSDIQRRLNEVAGMQMSTITGSEDTAARTQAMTQMQSQLEGIKQKVESIRPSDSDMAEAVSQLNKRIEQLSNETKAFDADSFRKELVAIKSKVDSIEPGTGVAAAVDQLNKRLDMLSQQSANAVDADEFRKVGESLSSLRGEVSRLMKGMEGYETTKSTLESLNRQVKQLADATSGAGPTKAEVQELNRNFSKLSESLTSLFAGSSEKEGQQMVKDEVRALHEELKSLATAGRDNAVPPDGMKKLASRVDELTSKLTPFLNTVQEQTKHKEELTDVVDRLNRFMKEMNEKVEPLSELRERLISRKREVVFDEKKVADIIKANSASEEVVFSTTTGTILYSSLPARSNKFVIAVMAGRMLASAEMLSKVLANKDIDHLQLITAGSRAVVRVSKDSWILMMSGMEADFMSVLEKSGKVLDELNASAIQPETPQQAQPPTPGLPPEIPPKPANG